jgi:hypothetical protein
MSKLIIQVDLPFIDTGIRYGDVLDAIEKSLAPTKDLLYRQDDARLLPARGLIRNEHDDNEVIGHWKVIE